MSLFNLSLTGIVFNVSGNSGNVQCGRNRRSKEIKVRKEGKIFRFTIHCFHFIRKYLIYILFSFEMCITALVYFPVIYMYIFS